MIVFANFAVVHLYRFEPQDLVIYIVNDAAWLKMSVKV